MLIEGVHVIWAVSVSTYFQASRKRWLLASRLLIHIMTSVRKKKMARSSVRKNTRRLKDKHRDVNIHGNPVIAAHWDKSLTLQQNYKRLGLRSKLGNLAGGTERHVETVSEFRAKRDASEQEKAQLKDNDDPENIPEGEARIIRDDKTNEVLRIVYGTRKVKVDKPEPVSEAAQEVLELLKQQGIRASLNKLERTQLERECEWLKSLYEKHGDDYEKMMWDKRLNIYQQSAGDLKKRVTKWKKANLKA